MSEALNKIINDLILERDDLRREVEGLRSVNNMQNELNEKLRLELAEARAGTFKLTVPFGARIITTCGLGNAYYDSCKCGACAICK